MFIRPIFLLFVALLLVAPVAYSAPLEDWDALIVEGSKKKYDGNYSEAAASFSKAVTFAEKQKLPNKCLPISLCRLAEAQLNANQVKEADSHFDQITNLFKTQKASGKLDSQVSFWVAALSDAYLSNHKPETRELCIKHACYLKTLAYGASHRNCTDCLNKLAEYYIDADKVDKALKILEMNEGLTAKQFGKNPDRFGNLLNDLAIKCEKEHKYNQAKQLEQEVIKIAQTNKSELRSGLPAFYCFLSINAIVQNKSIESEAYFQKALREASNVKGPYKRDRAGTFLNQLPGVIWQLKIEHKFALAETEYNRLLVVYKKLGALRDWEYDIFDKLANTLFDEEVANLKIKNMTKVIKCFLECASIAELPASKHKNNLPYLYLRLGCCYSYVHDLDKACDSFYKSLKADADKTGYHHALVLFYWGRMLDDMGDHRMGVQKLNACFKCAKALAPASRGTIFADLLQLLALKAESHGDKTRAKAFSEQSAAEIQLQKQLSSKLGPDAFHRM